MLLIKQYGIMRNTWEIFKEEVLQDLEEISAEEILEGVAEIEKCIVQSAVTVERTAKFLLNQRAVNQYIVLIVLKKWGEEGILENFKIEAQKEKIADHNPTNSLTL